MNGKIFDGKVALVTGGASGIGEACVLRFAHDGAKVVVADLNSELGEKIVASVKQVGGDGIFLRVDVSKPEEVENMVGITVDTFGRLDIAVNNAGIGGELKPTGEYSIAGWRKVIDVNLNGVFYCMRYEIPQMIKQGGGVIVNMASILGAVGFATAPAYVAAKHGLLGLTKAAALEYASQHIRINSVGPAFIKTPMVTGSLDEQMQTQIAGLHAIGRMGEPQEVASLTAFLCSDEATFMTGGYYLVDGGYTAR
jgi:NAD(P)-dependent dehydrogenase (short-subunit alcohol dehydrogenase family)